MDYKEKLRLAKEALDSGSYDKETIEYIFPELKESEDERIKEDLIQWINEFPDVIWRGHNTKDVIAWLEKQDPKKHEEELEKAYKTADEVQYRRGYEDAKREFEKQGEQKLSAWSEEDENLLKLSLENLTELKNSFGEKYGKVGDCIQWLKSIKERIKGE